jgi:hypothetical protein
MRVQFQNWNCTIKMTYQYYAIYIFHNMILTTVHDLFCNTITQHTPKWLELHYNKLLQKLCYLVYDVISRAGMKIKPRSSEMFTHSVQTMLTKSNNLNQILICWVSRTYSWMCANGRLLSAHTHTQNTHTHTQNTRTHFIYVLTQVVSGAFAELRKATMTFVMSICLSVRPSAHSPAWNSSATLEEFSWYLAFKYFSKICQWNSVFIKICCTWRPMYIFDNISLISS